MTKFIKLRQVLGMAAEKLEGCPESAVDEMCAKHGATKELVIEFLENVYGIKVMDYRRTLEHEFLKVNKKPKRQFVKNHVSRYPYYGLFTKDKFFLPLARKIWEGDDLAGDSRWEGFVMRFNEAMNNGWIPFKTPLTSRSSQSSVKMDKGTVEWEGDDVLTLITAEMRHFRDNPYIENSEWTMWEHYRDEFVAKEMKRRGYYAKDREFIEEIEDTRCGHMQGMCHDYQCCAQCAEVCNTRCSISIHEGGCYE